MAKDFKYEPGPNEFQMDEDTANVLRYMVQNFRNVKTQQDAVMGAVLAYIGKHKYEYPITQKTQFKISDDYKTLTLSEVEPKKQPQPEGGDAVKPAS